MRKLIAVAVAGLMFASAFSGGANGQAKYKSEFQKKYTSVAENHKIDCYTCHIKGEGKTKKDRNEYGKALAKVIAKKEKDSEKIKEALKKVESEKRPSDGKTWGEILNAGELPKDS